VGQRFVGLGGAGIQPAVRRLTTGAQDAILSLWNSGPQKLDENSEGWATRAFACSSLFSTVPHTRNPITHFFASTQAQLNPTPE
jgi:hypothetical protein